MPTPTGGYVSHGGPGFGLASSGARQATGNLGAVLKEEWSDEVTSQFNNEALAFVLLDEAADEELWQGEYYVEPLHTGRSRSGGPGSETDDYPSAGNQSFTQMQVGVSFYRTSGQISSKAMLSAERGEASAIRALTHDIRGGLRDLVQEVNVDLYNNNSGVLAVVEADPGGGVTTLRTAFNGASRDLAELNGSRFFSGGRSQAVTIGTYNPATAAFNAKRNTTVTSVDSRSQITTAAADGVAADDIILRRRSASDDYANAAGEATLSLVGLDQIIDDGTTQPATLDADYFGVNRTTSTVLNSHVRDLGGADLTEEVLQEFFDAIAETSGETPDCMLMHRSVRTKMAQLFQGDRRFVPQKFPGGWKGEYLVYNPGDGDIHVYVDRHCHYKTIYAINKSYLKRYTLAGAHLVDYDGSALRQSGSGPVWMWNVEAYFQMACTKPNTCGKLINIASDATFGVAGFNPEF